MLLQPPINNISGRIFRHGGRQKRAVALVSTICGDCPCLCMHVPAYIHKDVKKIFHCTVYGSFVSLFVHRNYIPEDIKKLLCRIVCYLHLAWRFSGVCFYCCAMATEPSVH